MHNTATTSAPRVLKKDRAENTDPNITSPLPQRKSKTKHDKFSLAFIRTLRYLTSFLSLSHSYIRVSYENIFEFRTPQGVFDSLPPQALETEREKIPTDWDTLSIF